MSREMELAKNLLFDLLSVYTPPRYEFKLIPVVRDWADKLGYDEFYVDDVGNIFLRLGSHGRTILLAGHLDTVPGEVDVKLSQDTIYGRGAVDAKGPLAAFILGAVLSKIEGGNSKVCVAGLVREEDDGLGSRHLVESGFKSDYIIVGEPTNLGVAIAYRGSILIRISANTLGGHSSAPHIGESALDKLIQFMNIVKGKFNGVRFDDVSCAFTVLRAGEWPSSLPKKGEAYANIRYPPRCCSEDIVREIKEVAQSVGVELEILSIEKPVEVSVNTTVVRALVRSILRSNLKPKIVKKTGTSDMNTLIAISKNITTFGPGDSRLAHTDYEKIRVDEVVTAARIISNALKELSRI
ncbi:MAG: N-acetyl-lysine deacetylase [Thaumarchaeota archaeon]|jgi:LysW-gamma-L-lysine carboxypeptidase|nr:N-acetyl-lysine deacetylase [Candidatus Geocrenenecus arthurdayi]